MSSDSPRKTTSAARNAGTRDGRATFVGGFLFLLLLQSYFRPDAASGIHFTPWSSEFLMQTVPLEDLRVEPLKSLWYLHIQPPFLDGLRALLVWLSPGSDSPQVLLLRVDSGLSLVWTALYAGTGALLCSFLNTHAPRALGFFVAAALFLHPAMLLYAGLPETSMATAFFTLLLCLSLWRLALGTGGVAPLVCGFLGVFASRSLFQWQALLVVVSALLVARVERRKIGWFIACTAPLVVALTLKQFVLFQIPYTSSFAGSNFCRAIHGCEALTDRELLDAQAFLAHHPAPDAAGVLTHGKALPGADNFNRLEHLDLFKRELLAFHKTLPHKRAGELLQIVTANAKLYFTPSSHYAGHVTVARVPWRSAYDAAFSGVPLALALLLSGVFFWFRHRAHPLVLRAALAISLPIGYIFAGSILLESGENQRFKFFLEPMMFAFILSQAFWLARHLYEYALGRAPLRAFACDEATDEW